MHRRSIDRSRLPRFGQPSPPQTPRPVTRCPLQGPDGCRSIRNTSTGLRCRPWAYWVLNENINTVWADAGAEEQLAQHRAQEQKCQIEFDKRQVVVDAHQKEKAETEAILRELEQGKEDAAAAGDQDEDEDLAVVDGLAHFRQKIKDDEELLKRTDLWIHNGGLLL